MAPQVPKKRTTARARISKSTHAAPKTTSRSHNDDFSSFKATKEDKRRLKHSSLVSRIEKANAKTTKRRRPSKKLVTSLESLADALPDAPKDESGDAVVEGTRIRHASLKSRPGALKRKEKLEGMERERFAKNMAQMSTGQAPDSSKSLESGAGSGTALRWAALRGFIQSTMNGDGAATK